MSWKCVWIIIVFIGSYAFVVSHKSHFSILGFNKNSIVCTEYILKNTVKVYYIFVLSQRKILGPAPVLTVIEPQRVDYDVMRFGVR